MNRLSPLIRRKEREERTFIQSLLPEGFVELDRAEGWTEDAKMFAIGWVGGLVFFGALFF